MSDGIGTFRGTNEDTDEGSILKSFLGKKHKKNKKGKLLSNAICGGALDYIVSKTSKKIAREIDRLLDENFTVSNISPEIQRITESIGALLAEDFKKRSINDKILPSISYRTYVFWVLEKIKKAGYDPYKSKFKDVPREHGEDIYNILRDKTLTTLFMVGNSLGILDFSKNDINKFEEENELKVLETTHEEVKVGLASWRKSDDTLSVTKHRGANIVDDYYDDENLSLDRQLVEGGKRSIRTRRKIYDDGETEDFYTIKRKLNTEDGSDEQARRCLEKEFEIKKKKRFGKLLEGIGMRKSRSKTKYRESFSIEYYDTDLEKQVHAKIDIDKYEGIPEFIEIECDDNDAIQNIIKKLGLTGKETLIKGSRGLFNRYGMKEKYQTYYNVDEESGEVSWDDGKKGQIKDFTPHLEEK